MKSVFYMALVLSVLMVAASIDSIPDPPALTPQTANLKASCLRSFTSGFREQRVTCYSACILTHVPTHRVSLGLEDATRPTHSSGWITLAAFAGGPSPPSRPIL
jgi:hypothetical protein